MTDECEWGADVPSPPQGGASKTTDEVLDEVTESSRRRCCNNKSCIVTTPMLRLLLLLLLLLLWHGDPARAAKVQCVADPLQDTPNLQDLLDGCFPGDNLLVLGPVCLVAETLVLPAGCSLEGGERTGTVLRHNATVPLPAVLTTSAAWNASRPWSGGPTRVAHLTVDGAGKTTRGALVVSSWLSTVRDVRVVNSAGDGLLVTSVGRDNATRITQSSQVNGLIDGVFVENSARHGIHVEDPGNVITDWYLLNSWVSTSGQSGVYLENAAGWAVRNNHVYGVGQHAIYARRCFATSISANYIEDFGGNAGRQEEGGGGNAGTFWGAVCDPVQGAAASIISENKVHMFRRNVSAARASGSTFNYVGVARAATQGVGVVSVVNNVIRGSDFGPGDTGLSYDAGGHLGASLQVLSSGNHVTQLGRGATPRFVGPNVSLAAGL